MMALLDERVISHLLRAVADIVKDDIPISLDAASAFTLCSRVKSTAALEKGFSVLFTVKAPFSSTFLSPGCDVSILAKLR